MAALGTPPGSRGALRDGYRPYGKHSLIFFSSEASRWLVPRRPTFCLWVLPKVARWRTPARRNFTLPLFFTWKRFLAPLLVLSLGIFFLSSRAAWFVRAVAR